MSGGCGHRPRLTDLFRLSVQRRAVGRYHAPGSDNGMAVFGAAGLQYAGTDRTCQGSRPAGPGDVQPMKKYGVIYAAPRRYMELFARRNSPSWDVWGNEVESDMEMEKY